ncbi:MAG TPA: YggS family pyridoxal phosphate-dependent enzyme [Dehalococcoidia bacterium]|nr:YggS family pyridoxal phosphate-dependent enzyme [Dehalococcoidia bacterium]
MQAPTIAKRLSVVRERIGEACVRANRSADEVTLIAVSKGFGAGAIRGAVEAGVTDIGENRVQEFEGKRLDLADLRGVTWHMIGNLQTNKAKAAVQLFDIIHSVDSLRLAEAISNRALSNVSVFMEVNVAQEATKSGFSLAELSAAVTHARRLHLDILGLMTVAPFASDPQASRPVFRALREEAQALGLRGLSMGMTNDYEVAIEEGATHVRIGRAIFGERPA